MLHEGNFIKIIPYLRLNLPFFAIFLKNKKVLGMKKFLLIGLGVLLVLILAVFFKYMNNIPKADEDVKAKWSQVQNQYKRRADLIPNLVKTVKGYAKHESETFTKVVEARAKATSVNVDSSVVDNPAKLQAFSKAQDALSSALSRLLVVVEKYPDLKADKNFLALQSQLEGTENRISVARRDFIESVRKYNLELRMIPNKFVASILHPEAKIRETFKASASEQKVPVVEF